MIDEIKTFEKFGYYSTDLKPHSHKKIWAICDVCKTGRWLMLQDYRLLCKSCSMSGDRNPMFGKRGEKSPIYGRIHTEEVKRRISNSHKGKVFSEEHKRKISENHAHLSGENHPNWNKNITDRERIIRREYVEYRDWRDTVYKRDNYTCKLCNCVGGILNAHHLDGYNANPNKRILLENGITLCSKCHNKFHSQYGKGNNTKEQFTEFLARN